MKRARKVKIIATLGSSSFSLEMIEKLFMAGADVFRLNMSHTGRETMYDLIKRIRKVEKIVRRPIGILVDLQGPKLRVGNFAQGQEDLSVGQKFTLDNREVPGDAQRVFFHMQRCWLLLNQEIVCWLMMENWNCVLKYVMAILLSVVWSMEPVFLIEKA